MYMERYAEYAAFSMVTTRERISLNLYLYLLLQKYLSWL